MTTIAALISYGKNTPPPPPRSATTWDPSNKHSSAELSNSNTTVFFPSMAPARMILATTGVTSGKWYWEYHDTGNSPLYGIAYSGTAKEAQLGGVSNSLSWNGLDWRKSDSSGTTRSFNASGVFRSTFAVALDMDNKILRIYGDNILAVTLGITDAGPYYPALGVDASSAIIRTVKFSSADWIYSPPAGHIQLP